MAKRKGPTPRRTPPAPPRPLLTPEPSPFRGAIERRSATFVLFLAHLPRPVPGLVVVALVAAALIAPPVVGGVALLVLALLLLWLIVLSWPRVPVQGRAIRLVVLALVVASALARLTGKVG